MVPSRGVGEPGVLALGPGMSGVPCLIIGREVVRGRVGVLSAIPDQGVGTAETWCLGGELPMFLSLVRWTLLV